MKCEIVVFSPARRASRKLLERMVEVRVPGQLHVNAMLTCFCARSSYAYWGTSPLSTTKVQIAAPLNTRCYLTTLLFHTEQCRVKSYDGREALIRSFPSKVGVSIRPDSNPHTTHTHVGERPGCSRGLSVRVWMTQHPNNLALRMNLVSGAAY